jgi:ribonuclease HI
MTTNYGRKLINSRDRLSKYDYSNDSKPRRGFQNKFVGKFQVGDNPEKYNPGMVYTYCHPDERYVEGFIQGAVNYFGLSQFVAERTKYIFASMWNDQKTLLQNIYEENAILGIMLSIVYKYFRTGTTIDVTEFVRYLYGDNYKKHLRQVYWVHSFVCSLYFNKIDLQVEKEGTAYLHELTPKNKIYFDGSCQNGIMAIGTVLLDGYSTVDKISRIKGSGTNNQAEYLALIAGLKRALELKWDSVTICGHSQLVIEQLKDEWQVKSDNLFELYIQAKTLIDQIEQVELVWIPRKENKMANCQTVKAQTVKAQKLYSQ